MSPHFIEYVEATKTDYIWSKAKEGWTITHYRPSGGEWVTLGPLFHVSIPDAGTHLNKLKRISNAELFIELL